MSEQPDGAGQVVAILEHLAAIRQLVAELVREELRELIPPFEEGVAQAASRLRDAIAALEQPEKDLAYLDQQIGEVEGRCAGWQAKTTDTSAETRVEAARQFRDWMNELSMLHADRELAEKEAEVLRGERDAAKAELATAQLVLDRLEDNLDLPLLGLGTATKSYRAWWLEQGLGIPVLLGGDPSAVGYPAAFDFLSIVALRSGWRSDHLPKDAERVRRSILTREEEAGRLLEDYAAGKAESRPAMPSALDVRDTDLRRAAQLHADSNRRERIEDLRGVPTPRNAASPGWSGRT